nr:glycosyltransferase [Aliiroseovarius sp. S1339]
MQDYRAHRDNYIGQLKRAKYFCSYIAKVERTQERGQQVEFGLRYLEGLAAGAIVLGNLIDSDAFREHIGWQDAVIDAPYDCPQIGDIITKLNEDPARCAAIRARNMTECLTRHDHLHRWEKVLELAGLTPHPKLEDRRAALAERVKMVEKAPDK